MLTLTNVLLTQMPGYEVDNNNLIVNLDGPDVGVLVSTDNQVMVIITCIQVEQAKMLSIIQGMNPSSRHNNYRDKKMPALPDTKYPPKLRLLALDANADRAFAQEPESSPHWCPRWQWR